MTFSIAAKCARTGMFGASIASSSVCVASRCVRVRAGVGVVLTQNVTDPRLGDLGLKLLEQGLGAEATLEALVNEGAYPEYRQLAVVDSHGHVAHHSGAKTLGTHGVIAGDGCIAAGNLLASETVPQAMVDAVMAEPAAHLAERLMRSLEAGLAAGGEAGEVRSAGLNVADRHAFAIVDLRVDWHGEPIAELRRVWEVYRPQIDDYVTRAIDPPAASAYGVPGEE